MKNRLAVFFLSSFLLFACSAQSKTTSLIGDWRLSAYGPASLLEPAVPGVDAVINFNEDGNVSGNLGCNHFGGDYQLKGDQITFSALASTLMACPDPQMAQEQAAFSVLSETVTYKIEDNNLSITNGNEILVFESLTQD
jgi:heat shock protein HslJ